MVFVPIWLSHGGITTTTPTAGSNGRRGWAGWSDVPSWNPWIWSAFCRRTEAKVRLRAAGVVCLVLHQQCGWRYYSDEEYGDEKTHMLIVGRLYRYDDRLNEL